MDIPVEQVGDVAVVTVPMAELDSSNAADFKLAMAPVLEAHANVVLDLSRLRFIDSSGMGTFLSCLRKVNAKGGDLKLCGMSPQVSAIIHLVRMQRMLDVFDTWEHAVDAFAAVQEPSQVI